MLSLMQNISPRGNPVIIEQDTYLFTSLTEGNNSPFNTKAFMYGRANDAFTLQNTGGTGGATKAGATPFDEIIVSPNKRWVAVCANGTSFNGTNDQKTLDIWENNFDGTLTFKQTISTNIGVANLGIVRNICFSPASNDLFVSLDTDNTGIPAIIYYRLNGSTLWDVVATQSGDPTGVQNDSGYMVHHPTLPKLYLAGDSGAGQTNNKRVFEYTYSGSAFTGISAKVDSETDIVFLFFAYSPNAEYYTVVAVNPNIPTFAVRLYKEGVGVVSTLTGTQVQGVTAIKWFSDSSHFVLHSGNFIYLYKRVGDSITLIQSIDYSGASIKSISLTRETFPALSIGAGATPIAGNPATGGWGTGVDRKHGRVLKFNPATGLFDTTPIAEFNTGAGIAFAPSAEYPA